jgi:hypothetical protein
MHSMRVSAPRLNCNARFTRQIPLASCPPTRLRAAIFLLPSSSGKPAKSKTMGLR